MTATYRRILIAGASLSIAAGLAAPAHAQLATYCEGNLVATAFTRGEPQGERDVTVSYRAMLENRRTDGKAVRVVVQPVSRIGSATVAVQARQARIFAGQPQDLITFTVRTTRDGMPTADQAGRMLQFSSCTYEDAR